MQKFHENRFISVAVPHKNSHKRGRISVMVGDKENFIESKIVEREILHSKCSGGGGSRHLSVRLKTPWKVTGRRGGCCKLPIDPPCLLVRFPLCLIYT